MSDIFISHVEEDADVALGIALGLEQAGYATWLYEMDRIPGKPYLEVTGAAIEGCHAFALLISPHSLGSHQVTREVERAHEGGKTFVPILCGVTHIEFQNRQPLWRQAVGTATSISVSPTRDIHALLPDLLGGLCDLIGRPTHPPRPERIQRMERLLGEHGRAAEQSALIDPKPRAAPIPAPAQRLPSFSGRRRTLIVPTAVLFLVASCFGALLLLRRPEQLPTGSPEKLHALLSTQLDNEDYRRAARTIDALLLTDPDDAKALAAQQRTDRAQGIGELRRFSGHIGPVAAVAFMPDGRRAISGGDDGSIRVWDLPGGEELRHFRGNRSIAQLAVSVDGRRIAASDTGGDIWLLDGALKSQDRRVMATRFGVPSALAFSPDGKRIAASGRSGFLEGDGGLGVWRLDEGDAVLTFARKEYADHVAFSPDGRFLLWTSGGLVRAWDLKEDRDVLLAEMTAGPVGGFSRGARFVVSHGSSGLSVWDIERSAEARQIVKVDAGFRRVVMAGNARRIVTSNGDGTVRVWDIDIRREVRRFPGYPRARTIAVSDDGRRALVGTDERNGVLHWLSLPELSTHPIEKPLQDKLDEVGWREAVHDIQPLKETHRVALVDAQYGTLHLSADGQSAAGMATDAVAIWDTTTGQVRRRFPTPEHHVGLNNVALAADGSRVAYAGKQATLVWDTATGDVRLTISGELAPYGMGFSSNGKLLVHGSDVWDVDRATTIGRVQYPANDAVAFSRDASLIALGELGVVHVWHTDTRSTTTAPDGIGASVVTFVPGRPRLLIGNWKRLLLWTIDASMPPVEFHAREPLGNACGAAFSPDASLLATSHSNTLRLWDVEHAKELGRARTAASAVAFAPGGESIVAVQYGRILKFAVPGKDASSAAR